MKIDGVKVCCGLMSVGLGILVAGITSGFAPPIMLPTWSPLAIGLCVGGGAVFAAGCLGAYTIHFHAAWVQDKKDTLLKNLNMDFESYGNENL